MKEVISIVVALVVSTGFLPRLQADEPLLRSNALQTSTDSTVDEAVRNYFRDTLAVGLSIGIIKNGKPASYHYGETEKGNGKLPDEHTFYEIGSVSKTFTGLLLALAVRDGRVQAEDDIGMYLDGDYPNLQYDGQPVRLIHLVNHTSGIPSNTDNIEQQQPFDLSNPFARYTAEMFDEGLHSVVLDAVPGTKQSYSNMGVALLGKILAGRYQLSYMDMVRHFILEPSGMKDTKVAMSREDMKRFAKPYDRKGQLTSYWDCAEFVPAGGLRSTLDDMLKYLAFNMSDNETVAFAQQKTFGTTKDGIAYGWGINEPKEHQLIYWHEGSTGGFTALCAVMPGSRSGVVILANSKADMSRLTSDMVQLLLK